MSQNIAQGAALQELAQGLRGRVKAEVGLNVTVGGGTSKSVAKIASQLAKPNGLLLVEPGTEQPFLADLDVELLWGIGPKAAQFLHTHGIKSIGELAGQPEEWFAAAFGKRGPDLHRKALGQDDSPVTPTRETKSVSAETTFVQDLSSREELLDELRPLVEGVARRLQRHGLQGRTVTVKLRLADFTTFTRQVTLSAPTDDVEAILKTARRLLERELRPGRSFRLIGAGLSNFTGMVQLPMFGGEWF